MDSSERQPRPPHASRRIPIRPRRVIAAAASIALHAALIYALSRMAWGPIEDGVREVQPEVVWLADWQPVLATRVEADVEPMSPEPLVDPEPEPEPESADLLEPADAVDSTEAADLADAVEPADVADTDDAEPSPTATQGRGRTYIVRDVDWDEERRQAVARVREQAQRESGYPTFSLADVFDEPPPEEPGPARSVFDTPKSGRALMGPGQARTRAGRWIGEKCNRILGGISVFGLVSLCASDDTPSDLFESIKPEYLKRRPEEFVVRPEDQGLLEPATP
jgi:hypothetical protein